MRLQAVAVKPQLAYKRNIFFGCTGNCEAILCIYCYFILTEVCEIRSQERSTVQGAPCQRCFVISDNS